MALLSKSHQNILVIINTLILFNLSATTLLVNALSFNFSDFSEASSSDMSLERAFRRDREIVLVNTNMAGGRAIYPEPLRVWDNATGRVTDFSTRFEFTVDSDNRTNYGDGMAFFLAAQGMLVNSMDDARGGSLGLIERDERFNASKDKSFVAVEFDVYLNHFDPVGEHVGIDVNSVVSVANVTWLCNVREGKKNEAFVVYNATTQELSVNFTGFRGNATEWQFLSHKLDLKSLLPEEVRFGFSAGTGTTFASFSVQSWVFESTFETPNNQPDSVPSSQGKKSNVGLALGLGIGGFVLVSGLFLLLCFFKKKKKKSSREEDSEARKMDKYWDDEFQKGTGPKKFSYDELERATNGFEEDSKLGQGGFGGVYKGFLTDLDSHVAVKKVSKGSSQGMREYAAEVTIISKLRHRNLVQLIGWCHERGDLLLVYEYMPNGSLDSHLFKGKSLSWEDRYKIAQGLASALLYLHEEWDQCVVHRDIKSSNVMLDSNFNAKLGDFGLAKLIDHSKGSETVTNVAGTPGYMAPEFFITYKASKETDIYSFGIVCLELACGRKPIDIKATEDQIEMVRWVWDLYGIGKILEAADPRLEGEDFEARQQIECLMVVGLWCAHPDYTLRPSISQVIQVLGFKNELPSLPPKMPVPTYVIPGLDMPTASISYGTSNFSEGQQSQVSSSGFVTKSSLVPLSSPTSSSSRSLIVN